MKNQKGISLITLIFTIILMLIITTIAMYNGFEAYDNMRVQAYVAKLKALQEKVDIFCDKYSVREINEMGLSYSQATEKDKNTLKQVIDMNAVTPLKSWSIVDESESNYRLFSIDDIEKFIGVKDFDVAIWLNPLTRNVIAVEGVKLDNMMYYRQYDLPGGQILEQPVFNTNTKLDYIVQTYDNKADIKLDKNYAKITCYLKNDISSVISTKVYTHTDTVTVTESGKYQLIATDYDRNVDDYSDYSEDVKAQYAGLEKITEDFNVTIVNKPMLVDGMIPVNDDGVELTTEEEKKNWYNYSDKKWANVRLADGSMYVWIPRYAYKIADSNIDIKFLREFSNITTEGKALDNGYKISPAFQDGTALVPSSFINGEWDSEITGFWVAKYEVIKNNNSIASIKTNSSSSYTTTPIDAFKICRELEKNKTLFKTTVTDKVSGEMGSNGEFPVDTNNIDTHLMKNSEYGAIVYLTHSKYGNLNVSPQNGIYPGNNCNESASTTGTKSGVYGLAGGRPEIVSAGSNIAGVFNLSDTNVSTKYATVYGVSTIYGDAVLNAEVSTWSASRTMPTSANPIFTRGGSTGSGNIFTYNAISTTDNSTSAFRPVIVIEY